MYNYLVEYDYLIGGKYRPQKKTVEAKNAKEACEIVKNEYNDKVCKWADKHRTTFRTAMRNFHHPFHISAKRIKEVE